jgi:hypothetical protein
MGVTVNLDNQPRRLTDEIGHEPPEPLLPPELGIGKGPAP